ncbi:MULTISPECIES: recombinase family protein [unclassified Bradyrhizobium]|uniref:recombinase family protein n=1 Tax=unclassified Bradyrhizobium TaxID=2631580 RepID=UPI00209E7C34|nr:MULTISPECIES: recombinase family protein [unclassified Bradyrhizobium]
MTARDGFQRLVSEVALGKAGIVMGLEVSRLARNSGDWHRLIELCALTATLILDEDGISDPANFNDRLLLWPQRYDERGRAAHPQSAHAWRSAQQGPPRRARDVPSGRVGLPERSDHRPRSRPPGAERNPSGVRYLRADRKCDADSPLPPGARFAVPTPSPDRAEQG